jgi:exonuclease SbcC
LEDLKQTIVNFEVALDASAISAAMIEKREQIHKSEIDIRALEATKDQAWLTYFEELRDILQNVQDRAVSSYTQHFGPQASIIQERLRSVFGFENIELAASKGNIEVRIIRNGELLRPPDYFSQSQQQILMLSLFLTACMTQTWSEFAPIFLDDPVTHFDDLNTYAFLDLMGGLLDTSLFGHQVVISTCEERLYQVARQKFAAFGNRVKFYRFVSLSNQGPIIEQE